jgi:glycosyltransferase involved in cell wall biosynthesis
MINYSIIIPHKNSEDLLKRCLESIPRRSDIQIVVVDDKSLDSDKISSVVSGFENAQLILTEEELGAGYARNVGLKYAMGKWLLFADADDFYHEGAFDVLDDYIDTDYEIIYFYANSVDSITYQTSPRAKGLDRFQKKYHIGDRRSEDYIRIKLWAPWNKMIRNEFWKRCNVYFDETPFGNDMNFAIKVSLLAKKYVILTEPLYCLTYTDSSISYKERSYESESYSFVLRAQQNIYFKLIGRSLWHRYDFVYMLQMLYRKGLKYTIPYLFYIITHYKEISEKANKGRNIINEFLISKELL